MNIDNDMVTNVEAFDRQGIHVGSIRFVFGSYPAWLAYVCRSSGRFPTLEDAKKWLRGLGAVTFQESDGRK